MKMYRFDLFLLFSYFIANLVALNHAFIRVTENGPRDNKDVSYRISRAEFTTIDQRPYLVIIYDYVNYQNKTVPHFLCSGALISDSWVLTAGHCLYEKDVKYVKAGTSNRLFGGETREVVSKFIHKDFDLTTLNYDIGLIKVNPFSLKNTIGTINLPEIDVEPQQGGYTISGWGSDEKNQTHYFLRTTSVNLYDSNECRSNLYKNMSDVMFCAGNDGKDTCMGDSGTPLVKDNVAVGVASGGYFNCGENPGLYMKVSKFRDGIRQITGI